MSAARPDDASSTSATLASVDAVRDQRLRPQTLPAQDDTPATAVSWIVAGLLGFSGVLLTREGLYRRRLGAAVRAVQARGEVVPPKVMRRLGGSGRSGLLIAAGLGARSSPRPPLIDQHPSSLRPWRHSLDRWLTFTSPRGRIDATESARSDSLSKPRGRHRASREPSARTIEADSSAPFTLIATLISQRLSCQPSHVRACLSAAHCARPEIMARFVHP